MSETSLSSLVKEIGEALVLDDDNNDKAAYKKYVSCIYKIATNLILTIRQAGGDVVVDSKTSKQVKLVQQCVERVITLLEKMDFQISPTVQSSAQHSPTAQSSPTVQSPSQSLPTVQSSSQSSPMVQSSAQSSLTIQSSSPNSVPQQQHMPVVQANQVNVHSSAITASVPSLNVEKNPNSYRANKSHHLTPMEIARKQNQSLMAAYKARMERLNRADFSAFNYSLTIQRKMAENIAIAQAQEDELARKMQARNLRLEEEAAKRFATPVGMSKEEQEQRQIYKKILEYENDAKWLKNWRNRLEANPEDPILINQLVQDILRCSDHPFTELLHKYQFQIYQRLYPLVANRHEEVDMVTVPLPLSVWPCIDDVTEIFSDNIYSVISKERSSLRKDNEDSVSITRIEDNAQEKRKSLQVNENNALVERSEEAGDDKRTDVFESESDLQTEEKIIFTDNRNVNLNVAQSDVDSWDDPLRIRSKLHSSVKVILEDGHEHLSLNEYNNTLSSCDHPTGEASGEHDIGDLNVVETDEMLDEKTDEILDEREVSDTNTVIEQLTAIEEEQDSNTLNDIPEDTTKEEVTAQNTRKISKQNTYDIDNNTGDRHEESYIVDKAKTSLRRGLAVDNGKELESQVSWERRQAQLLMRQVTKDYSSYSLGHSDYDENNLDYLFDDNDDEDYGWFANYDSVKIVHQNDISSTLQEHTPSELTVQNPSSSFDRSVSHTPIATNINDDTAQFQSLPIHLVQEGKSHEEKEFEKLSQAAYQRHLKSISDDIHRYLEQLLVMMTIAYEPLDTPIGKDQCAVSLEEPFFKPIWKTLLRLFRVVNHKHELVLASVMTKYMNTTPADFQVSKKLWLTDSVCKPYQSAVTELMNVKEHYTMLNKLECIVKVCRLICESVDNHYNKKSGSNSSTSSTSPSVGADDLLPILSYVIVQCSTPQLWAECHAMTEFIHEGYMMGEEGYCLTSLRTALNYVISLFPSLIVSYQTQERQ